MLLAWAFGMVLAVPAEAHGPAGKHPTIAQQACNDDCGQTGRTLERQPRSGGERDGERAAGCGLLWCAGAVLAGPADGLAIDVPHLRQEPAPVVELNASLPVEGPFRPPRA